MSIKNPQHQYIIIDAGTFLTMDLVNRRGLEGGHISPGLNAQLSNYSIGHKLPSPTIGDLENYLNRGVFPCWPTDTMTAILEAVRKQNLSLIEGIQKQVPYSQIILTGGHAFLVNLILSTSTYKLSVKTSPYLVHSGLNLARKLLTETKEI